MSLTKKARVGEPLFKDWMNAIDKDDQTIFH
jgi:hypothetical protein